MRVSFPRTSCELSLRILEVQSKEENGRCAEGVGKGSRSKLEIDRRWIDGSKPFHPSRHARPNPRFQFAKWVKGRKHPTVEMGSESNL